MTSRGIILKQVQPLFCDHRSEWIGGRIIDVARSPITNRICIRVAPIRNLTLFDEYVIHFFHHRITSD
jgi:hypothetical protein